MRRIASIATETKWPHRSVRIGSRDIKSLIFRNRTGTRSPGKKGCSHATTEGTSYGPLRRHAMDLAAELQKIYDSEINVEMGWLWDGGIDVRLGDWMNGFLAEENVTSVPDILPWLQEAIAHFYLDSTYARLL